MKKASFVLLCGILAGVVSPGLSFAQTATATMTVTEQTQTIQQLQLIVQLLQQVLTLKAQLARLQSQVIVVPSSAFVTSSINPNAPIISNITSSAKQTSITITWTTDKDTRSTVDYWASYYRTKTVSNTQWLKKHTQTLSDLAAGTFYTIRITAKDNLGNVTVYPDQVVKTLDEPDKTKPTISNIQVSNVTRSGAVVSWTTNENTKSKLYYGTVDPLKLTATTTKSITDTSLGRSHVFFLSNLQALTTYYYLFEATDVAGNKQRSEQRKFSTTWR